MITSRNPKINYLIQFVPFCKNIQSFFSRMKERVVDVMKGIPARGV